ncbi:hypothetical protein HDG38_002003 [Paraburkholderia sp. WSM4177]|nr:hypothetical protein [Paraburkholderia sp. WSM4177]MBB5484387.1 hypothetical protein [Paraburkholderia sp. WSM4180]
MNAAPTEAEAHQRPRCGFKVASVVADGPTVVEPCWGARDALQTCGASLRWFKMEKPDGAGRGECPFAEYSNSAGRSPTYGTTWFYSQRYLV